MSPSHCHSMAPSTIQRRIAGASAFSFSVRSRSRSSLGMVIVNGTSRKRRRIASSTVRKPGLWLPAMMNLCVGWKSKKSPRMNRPLIGSPPVRVLSLHSSHRLPFCVSWATTSRAPRSLAISVG